MPFLAQRSNWRARRMVGTEFNPPTGFIVDEVANEAAVASHADVLWYPDLTSWTTVSADFSYFNSGVYGAAPATWPKLEFTTAAEFGNIPALRFESVSLTPDTTGQTGGYGSTDISALWKYFNEYTRTERALTGSSLWSGQETRNNLYIRYCFMLEDDVWDGLNETGMKLPGFQKEWKYNEGIGYCHLWMHHSVPGQTNDDVGDFYNPPYPPNDPIYLASYWAGDQLHDGETYSQNRVPGGNKSGVIGFAGNSPILQPNTWHTIEQRWKVNSMQPDGTGNFDAEVDVWFDDVLIISLRNTRVRSQYRLDVYDPPSSVDSFYLIIYHGGMTGPPAVPIHYRITGVCLSDRRIGKPKVV